MANQLVVDLRSCLCIAGGARDRSIQRAPGPHAIHYLTPGATN